MSYIDYGKTPSQVIDELRGKLVRETEKRERFEEENWSAHKWLDDQGIPRADVGGEVFSLVGRMMRLAKLA